MGRGPVKDPGLPDGPMNDTLRRRLLLTAPVALSTWIAWIVCQTWWFRLPYPFDLEWMEGGILAHAWRLQHLKPLYVEPSAEFVPMIYPPGYYALLATLGLPLGLSAPLGRALSIAGTLASCVALVWASSAYLRRLSPGLIAAGLYLGTYELTGAFQDLVRPDAVSLGLLSWALVLAPRPDPRMARWAGFLLFLAFTVKHNAGAFLIAVAPALWVWRGRGHALGFAAAFVLPAILFVGLLELTSGGNFLAYLLGVPGSHPMKWRRALPGTPTEIAAQLPIVCLTLGVFALGNATRVAARIPVPAHVLPAVVTAAAMVLALSSFKEAQGGPGATGLILVGMGLMATLSGLIGQLLDRRLDGPWTYGSLVVIVALVTAGMMRGHHGGFVNVFMPACWVLCAGFAVAIAQATDEAPRHNGTALMALAASVQLAFLAVQAEPDKLTPKEEDYRAGELVLAHLRAVEGPVLSPFAAFLPALVGKEPSTHLIALWDVGHAGGPFKDGTRPMREALESKRWAAIVDGKKPMGYGARKHYRVAAEFPLEGNALMPRTGWRARPTTLLTPDGKIRPIPALSP